MKNNKNILKTSKTKTVIERKNKSQKTENTKNSP